MKLIKDIIKEESIETPSGLLEKHPEVWTQCDGSDDYTFRTKDGTLTEEEEEAFQCCILGAISMFGYSLNGGISKVKPVIETGNVGDWNDIEGRTVQEVIEVLKEAGL